MSWRIALVTGWTLEYIKALSPGEWHVYSSMIDSDDKVAKTRELTRKKPKPPKRRWGRGRRR